MTLWLVEEQPGITTIARTNRDNEITGLKSIGYGGVTRLLYAFIGGVGTIHGPVLGALFYVILREALALRLVDLHLLLFGALFVLVVLLFPGGLVGIGGPAQRFLGRFLRYK